MARGPGGPLRPLPPRRQQWRLCAATALRAQGVNVRCPGNRSGREAKASQRDTNRRTRVPQGGLGTPQRSQGARRGSREGLPRPSGPARTRPRAADGARVPVAPRRPPPPGTTARACHASAAIQLDFACRRSHLRTMVTILDKRPRHPEKAHKPDTPVLRKPDWIRVKVPASSPQFAETRAILREHGLVTVCEEAGCPNIAECWAGRHATMMIMGDTCTRACAFCNVKTGLPGALDARSRRTSRRPWRSWGSITSSSRRWTGTIWPTAGRRILPPPSRHSCADAQHHDRGADAGFSA